MRNEPATFVFVTGHRFGWEVLSTLLRSSEYGNDFVCELVVGLSQKKKEKTVGFADPTQLASEHNIPSSHIESIKLRSSHALIQGVRPDYLFVIGWSELAPATILDIPRLKHHSTQRHSADHGCIGMHPTLLPEGRGQAPIPWAIIKGLDETGVSSFLLEDTADSGSVIDQVRVRIADEDNATALLDKMIAAHKALTLSLIPMIASRALRAIPQDSTKVTVWKRRRPEDGLLDFDADAGLIARTVRALTAPYPGAYFYYSGQKITVNEAVPMPLTDSHDPGTLVDIDASGHFLVACGSNAVLIKQYHPSPIHFIPGTRLEVKED